ncbi:MAG: Holliday junction branch migration protein RuvA [Marinilabiliales bacterium]|nr:Holliday junction branch migration protein RuvA [Marinilabiliales bacterium]
MQCTWPVIFSVTDLGTKTCLPIRLVWPTFPKPELDRFFDERSHFIGQLTGPTPLKPFVPEANPDTMYEYIEGALKEKNPTHCVIEAGGVGYFIHISLSTYAQLEPHAHAKLFIHQVIREDAHLLFGFFTKTEREVFRLLLTVSGIGSNTARMMLSSLSAEEIRQTILVGNASFAGDKRYWGQNSPAYHYRSA